MARKRKSRKLPYMPFYPSEYLMDTDGLSEQANSFWIRVICHLWYTPDRGRATYSVERWAGIGRITPGQAKVRIEELKARNIADILYLEEADLKGGDNADITVVCRRMVRDEKARQANALRQRHWQKTRRHNGDITGESHQNNGDRSDVNVRSHILDIRDRISTDNDKDRKEGKEELPLTLPMSGNGIPFSGPDYSRVKPVRIESREHLWAIADPVEAAISVTGETSKQAWGFWAKLNASAKRRMKNGDARELFMTCLDQVWGEMQQGEIDKPGAVLNMRLKAAFGLEGGAG